MIRLTVSELETVTKSVERPDGKPVVTFESARLDKYFKNIDPRLCVDVAIFKKTLNVTYWLAGTKTYVRAKYGREFDNSLGIILYATYKNIKALYSVGYFESFLSQGAGVISQDVLDENLGK